MPAAPLRVASVPAAHPYVQHLQDPIDNEAVIRLPDPPPLVAAAGPGQWWPPRMLDLDWVREHRDEFDLMHLHFGFDDATPEHLSAWIRLLRMHSIPLVMTVHDLVNPHFADPTAHLAQLDLLVPAAAALITLTDTAAARILDHWGRAAVVIPHPHIVPLSRIHQPVTAGETSGQRCVIGVHAKSLRANIDPLPVLVELLPALTDLPTVVLRVDVHPDVLDGADPDPRAIGLRRWIDATQGHPQVRIEVHPRLDDDQLWDYLQSIDLCILPYRFGTHSGWLEACVDLDTSVLVPAAGCYQDQHGHPSYGPGTTGLLDRVRAIVADPASARPVRPDRWAQRQAIAAAHEHVYRRVLASRNASKEESSTPTAEVGTA